MAMGMAAPCTGVSRPLARGLGVARASGVQRGPIERQAPPGGAPPAAERDPEGLFKGVPMRDGAIARRMLQKRVEVDQDFAKAMASAGDDLRKEQLLRRETRRSVPRGIAFAQSYYFCPLGPIPAACACMCLGLT